MLAKYPQSEHLLLEQMTLAVRSSEWNVTRMRCSAIGTVTHRCCRLCANGSRLGYIVVTMATLTCYRFGQRARKRWAAGRGQVPMVDMLASWRCISAART